MRFLDTLTDEDRAIFLRAAQRNRESLIPDYMVLMGDANDYHAMLALTKWRAQWPGYPGLPARMEEWLSKREPRALGHDYILSTCKGR